MVALVLRGMHSRVDVQCLLDRNLHDVDGGPLPALSSNLNISAYLMFCGKCAFFVETNAAKITPGSCSWLFLGFIAFECCCDVNLCAPFFWSLRAGCLRWVRHQQCGGASA